MLPFPNPMCAGGLYPHWAFDPAAKGANVTLSNANLTMAGDGSVNFMAALGTAGKPSGSWYTEFICTSGGGAASNAGIMTAADNVEDAVGRNNGWGYWANGEVRHSNIIQTTYATYTSGDVVGVAFTAAKVWFSKNGTWQSGDPATNAGGLPIAAGTWYAAASTQFASIWSIAAPLRYVPPSGFSVL